MGDPRSHLPPQLDSPAIGGFAITPSDTVDLSTTTGAIYVGGAGDVKVIMKNGDTITFSACPVGLILPVRATRVLATGTTATLLVGLY